MGALCFCCCIVEGLGRSGKSHEGLTDSGDIDEEALMKEVCVSDDSCMIFVFCCLGVVG